jgi:hypothetical protein
MQACAVCSSGRARGKGEREGAYISSRIVASILSTHKLIEAYLYVLSVHCRDGAGDSSKRSLCRGGGDDGCDVAGAQSSLVKVIPADHYRL